MKKKVLTLTFLSLLGGTVAFPLQAQPIDLASSTNQLTASISSLNNAKKLNIQVSYFIGSNLIGNLGKDPTVSDGIPFWEEAEIRSEGESLTKLKDVITAEKISDQAIALSRQALSENPGDKERLRQHIISLRNRATLYGMNRQYEQAERQYAEALNAALSPDARRHRIPLATELFNRLGLLSESQGDDKQAEEFYRRGYQFALSISPKVTDIIARQWTTAKVDNASGKPINVIQHTFKVPNINYEDEGFFNLCLNLGALYERQNKYKEAVFFTWTASKHTYENNTRRLNRPDIHELIRSRMFRIFARLTTDDIDDIFGGRMIVRAFIGTEYDIKLYNLFLTSLMLYKASAELTRQTTDSLVTLALRFKTNVQGDELLEYDTEPFALRRALISKARLLDADEKRRAQKCLEDHTVKDLCRQLYKSYEVLSQLVFAQQQGNSHNSFLTRYQDLNKQISSLKQEIQLSILNLYQPKSELKDFQALMPKDAALVEIVKYRPPKVQPKFNDWWDEWHYAAAVFKTSGNPHWVDLGSATEVEASVAKFRTALSDRDAAQSSVTNPKDLVAVQQAGRELDQRVMAKIRPLLGNAERLLISADGQLNLVPFEALRDETGKYLIQRYQFSYLTSGRDLLSIAESRQKSLKSRQDALILADPDYYQPTTPLATNPANSSKPSSGFLSSGSTASVDSLLPFDQAPGTAQLAQTLKSKILPTATVLTQATATKTALQQSPNPRILVLATHGFFVPNSEKEIVQRGDLRTDKTLIQIENPLLRSGLALAGANRNLDSDSLSDGDNGILTALEVAGLDLRGTQLVVLSACETGVGAAKVGDGVYGLRRALVIAGAESQILSLWKVDDTATKDLMIDYFNKLVKDGKGRHDALQSAKLELMQNPQYNHPYYWASFIPSGDWTPLR